MTEPAPNAPSPNAPAPNDAAPNDAAPNIPAGETAGRCQCGACGFAFAGPPNWVGHCHCESCRRATSSAITTYLGVDHGKWRWTGAAPAVWESSPGRRWLRCPTCGSLVAYMSQKPSLAHEIHFMRALIDTPSGLTPTEHYHWEERVDWLPIHDALEKHTG